MLSIILIVELSDPECKIAMVNMLVALTEQVDNMQRQMDNISRKIKTLNKDSWKCYNFFKKWK